MRRRSFIAAMLGVLLAVTVGGCGIPDETGVHVEGAGPARGDGTGPEDAPKPPDRRNSDDPRTFVTNYLQAAAGEIGSAYERVKEYIAPNRRAVLREPQGQELGVNVVRLIDVSVDHRQDNTSAVTIRVQQVGVLRSDGVVHPPELTDVSYELLVGRNHTGDLAGQRDPAVKSSGLWVIDPPPVLLMSEQALKTYYDQRNIYFWTKDRMALVPDLRHLPRAVPESRRADELVGWLTRGPAGWLAGAVAALPAGTQKIGNVTQDRGRLVVNLATELGPDPKQGVDNLVDQLIWTLDRDADDLELKIKDESRAVVKDTALRRNQKPLYPVNGRNGSASAPPVLQAFCVYAGRIHPLKVHEFTSGQVPVVDSANQNVAAAAFTPRSAGNPVWAALVVKAGEKRRLLVGTGVDAVESFEQSRTFAQMRRPIWLRPVRPEGPDGLIVADGQLYRFGRGASLTPVQLPQRTVTSVAAALDGRRIAFIADGSLYVAALTVTEDGVRVHTPRLLHTQLNDLTAVEWVGENRLVMAGVAGDGQVALYEIADDGTLEERRVGQRGKTPILHLAAYPENPDRIDPVQVMYEANGVTWDGYEPPERLDASHVDGVADSPESAGQAPTAPFFVY
ncbi:MAG TPA: LpqB family beta-propeller domain-containing protein [Micromonosporaceae bacterium]|nr:LpqB family beta-propeller domain-containing protein [Micromonosporaceae bacterium]